MLSEQERDITSLSQIKCVSPTVPFGVRTWRAKPSYVSFNVTHWLCRLVPGNRAWRLWALTQYKNDLSRCGNFHYKDKTVVGPSYLYNGKSNTDGTTSLYWDGPLFSLCLDCMWYVVCVYCYRFRVYIQLYFCPAAMGLSETKLTSGPYSI